MEGMLVHCRVLPWAVGFQYPFLNKNLKYTSVDKDKVEQRFLSQETVTLVSDFYIFIS